jgi:hypothetical protein
LHNMRDGSEHLSSVVQEFLSVLNMACSIPFTLVSV